MTARSHGIDVALVRQVTLAPELLFLLPLGDQSRDRGGRESRAVGAQQSLHGLREVAGARGTDMKAWCWSWSCLVRPAPREHGGSGK